MSDLANYDGFLEFSKPASDRMPSFAELLHDRAAFTESASWLPEDFVYMGKDGWGQDAICGVSSREFLAKPGYRLALKTADIQALSPLSIEYAAPHLNQFDWCPGPSFTATQAIHVRQDEWDHTYVFCVCLDSYRQSQQRHQPHVLRFTGDGPVGAVIFPCRVVVKDHFNLDWVSAVPDLRVPHYDILDDLISYLQSYYRGRS